MNTPKRYTITAALPYTNGPIHIGHLAGVYVPSDIYARYLRLTGKDVAYICGSDEHGVAIPMRAKKEGVSPQDIIDKYHGIIKKSFSDFIIFKGTLSLNQIYPLYENSHIAIGSIGLHRKKMMYHSELKSREYTAIGIPFISTGIDLDFSNEEKFRITIDWNLSYASMMRSNNFRKHQQFEPNVHILEVKYEQEVEDESDRISQYFYFRSTKNSKYWLFFCPATI